MQKIKSMLLAVLEFLFRLLLSRKNVVVRLLFVLLYCVVSLLLIFAVLVLTVIQFAILLITARHMDAIKTLAHRLTVQTYRMLRYITLNENQKPYPFGRIADILEAPEETDLSTPVREEPYFRSAQPAEDPPADAAASQEPDGKTGSTDVAEPIILGQEEDTDK